MIKHSLELQNTTRGIWFILNKGKLWLDAESKLPEGQYSSIVLTEPEQCCWIGQYQNVDCYLVVNHDQISDEQHWHSVRALLLQDAALFELAARASQVALFIQTHRFCGQCGCAMHLVHWELAMLCHKCGHRCYPRIAPCVLVAVVKDRQILLARSNRHKQGFFSILAGFVESAETLEQAAIREVKEEVGVDISHLRYVGSQPWPFPHSLMTGFIAEYISGDIVCQPQEIEEAYWFDLDALPEVPPKETLSGQIIEQVRLQLKNGK